MQYSYLYFKILEIECFQCVGHQKLFFFALARNSNNKLQFLQKQIKTVELKSLLATILESIEVKTVWYVPTELTRCADTTGYKLLSSTANDPEL